MIIMCVYLYMNPTTSLQTLKLRYPEHHLVQNTLIEILIDILSAVNSVLDLKMLHEVNRNPSRASGRQMRQCCLTSVECSKLWTMPPSRIYFLGLCDVHFSWNFPLLCLQILYPTSFFFSINLHKQLLLLTFLALLWHNAGYMNDLTRGHTSHVDLWASTWRIPRLSRGYFLEVCLLNVPWK